MNQVVALRCRCGEVEGTVKNASPRTVNRVICLCADCQAFAHHLGRAELLDAQGGSDIVQVAPATLSFQRGTERIAALRFSPKGPFRFYADCCKTPLGNTVKPAIPFVGILAQAFERPDERFGPPIGAIHGKYAIGTPPAGSMGLSPRIAARAVYHILRWKLGGQTWPHPYFERRADAPRYPLTTLSRAEREALRPLCGPKP